MVKVSNTNLFSIRETRTKLNPCWPVPGVDIDRLDKCGCGFGSLRQASMDKSLPWAPASMPGKPDCVVELTKTEGTDPVRRERNKVMRAVLEGLEFCSRASDLWCAVRKLCYGGARWTVQLCDCDSHWSIFLSIGILHRYGPEIEHNALRILL